MTKPIYRINVSDEEFRHEAEAVFLYQLKHRDVPPNSWAHDMLKRGFTFVLKGEFHAALDMVHLIHERDYDGFCSIRLEDFPVSVFWNPWDLLEEITPEASPCDFCGEVTDKTGLVNLRGRLSEEFPKCEFLLFWDLFERTVQIGPDPLNPGNLKTEWVETVCEGCLENLRGFAEKLDDVHTRISKKYEERYGGEFFFDESIDKVFVGERYEAWKPIFAQISTPWKFREK